MEAKTVREYAQIMQDMKLTALEINEESKEGKRFLRLEKAQLKSAAEAAGTVGVERVPQGDAKVPAAVPVLNGECITSPMVGMFYTASAEDAEPFVRVGDHVKAGDTVCIIEAMKLMNEIVTDKDGIITEILATNGTIVEFGQPLFGIRKE